MVEIGDKVFVAPLYGQKDNIAVITGPAGGTGAAGTGGIIEGDYNTWTWKWTDIPDNGIATAYGMDILIDEKNEKLSILYEDKSSKKRLSIYNISDFSAVYESPGGANYIYDEPNMTNKSALCTGMSYFAYGGFSQSLQTYLLLLRNDVDTIEVWQGGASALWSTNTQTDFGAASTCDAGGISVMGKYILVIMYETTSPYDYNLMLYEGFDAGTSTGVTETTISDTSKSWATDALIGHIVYITSGGADGQQGTITSNTGAVITCTAATFVTWGMSVGDTYKIS